MARVTALDKLQAEVGKILLEYGKDIERNIDLITKEMGHKGAMALRQQSRQKLKKRTGEYAKGWTYAYRKTRRYAKTTIYNEHYSLPHLLEHGHVTRNGTSRLYSNMMKPTPAHVHIAPVAEMIEQTYMTEVENKL